MNTNKQQDDASQNVPPSNRIDKVPEEVTKEMAKMKLEEENDVDKKTKTTTTAIQDKESKEEGDACSICLESLPRETAIQDKESEEKGDECSICLESLPRDVTKFVLWTCCDIDMHIYCCQDLTSMKMGHTCPLCRAKRPTSDEEHVTQLCRSQT